jgi:hypothetical protein
VRGQLAQHVWVLDQLHGRRPRVVDLLDLLTVIGLGSEVGDRGGHHDRVGDRGLGQHRIPQLCRCGDRDHLDPGRIGQLGVRGD